MCRFRTAAMLGAALGTGAAAADQPLTVEVTPDDSTQYAIHCTEQGETVIQHAGDEPQVFGFDQGPVECRLRIVGGGGVEVVARGPQSRTRSRVSGRNAVVTFTLQ